MQAWRMNEIGDFITGENSSLKKNHTFYRKKTKQTCSAFKDQHGSMESDLIHTKRLRALSASPLTLKWKKRILLQMIWRTQDGDDGGECNSGMEGKSFSATAQQHRIHFHIITFPNDTVRPERARLTFLLSLVTLERKNTVQTEPS